ncbi:T9SS type A sorting domain-containing protein [Lutibacter citreus]|uniref:T9SS type A sorting domain-containing protein n=1 Tax=Lutibacter citreus TaxID=2138210 RepID=UPI000DBEA32F|nr:T9SS type A sorting domain-containing protein [Lutibacter citreus]
MKQKLLLLNALFLFFIQFTQAQNNSNKYLVRSTTGVAGSSENIAINNQQYTVQQSFGQVSVIGTFSATNYMVRQGFIQPNVFAKIRDTSIPLNLEAIAYPNPFVDGISISFSEQITDNVEVAVFDVLGRLVFSKSYIADQNLQVQFNNLMVGGYILKVTANSKQFVKKILKK